MSISGPFQPTFKIPPTDKIKIQFKRKLDSKFTYQRFARNKGLKSHPKNQNEKLFQLKRGFFYNFNFNFTFSSSNFENKIERNKTYTTILDGKSFSFF